VQQLLEIIGELMRPVHPAFANPGRIMPRHRVLELLLDDRVLEPVELEREEQRFRRDLVALLLHVLQKSASFRRAHVGREEQLREAHYPMQPLEDQFVSGYRVSQSRA
jgi:hypothetical protein